MNLKFSDGVEFNTDGNYRLERFDGLYVVGGGLLCPVDSEEEGDELIEGLKNAKPL